MLFVVCLLHGYVLQTLGHGIIIPLVKVKSASLNNSSNCRGISLDRGLLVHTPKGPEQGSPKKILIVKIQNWPKIQRVRLNNFRVTGVSSRNVFQSTCRKAGMINWVQFLEGPPQKFVRSKKHPKFGAISDNFRPWSRISPERIHISKIGKVPYQLPPLSRWVKKVGVLWSINEKVIEANVYRP